MPDIFTLIGWILTIVFGITSLIQFLEERARRRNIMALRETILSMTELSVETLGQEEATHNPERLKQTIIALYHMSRAAKGALNTLLPRNE
jgi:hypothetical protein